MINDEAAGAADHDATHARAQLRLERVDIRAFRGLTTSLEPEPTLTVLVGRNNSGKSRILRAIALALGNVPAEVDDLTVRSAAPAEIDVVVCPVVAAGEPEEFSEDIGQVVEPELVSLEPPRERFAWRATIQASAEAEGARADFARLSWNGTGWELPSRPSRISRSRELRYLDASIVDTRRDLSEEQGRRGTAIRRLLTSLDIAPGAVAELEDALRGLGERVVDESEMLQAISQALQRANDRVGGFGEVGLRALPASLEELARAVSFELDSGVGGPLPMRFHGSGARSLASLLVQGVYYDRRLGRDRPERLPHPVSLVEEPEAHLHPQMQADLPRLLADIPGQVIASTHSATFVTEVDHDAIRLLRPQADGTIQLIDLKADDPETVHAGPAATATTTPRLRRSALRASEVEKVKRFVERPFGEVLFASAIVVGDGATERAFLPPVLRHAMGGLAHGIVVVDPEGMAKAEPLVKLADATDLPWYLFVDGDGAGTTAGQRICGMFGETDPQGSARRIQVTSGAGATEAMLLAHDEALCRRAVERMRPDLEGSAEPTLSLMQQLKGILGSALAIELVDAQQDPATWPESLRTLVQTLTTALRSKATDGPPP